jgi:hypothetical protein
MKRAVSILLLVFLTAPAVGTEEELPRVSAEPVFVMREGAPSAEWPAHPGEVVGLALEWPEDARPLSPRLGSRDRESLSGEASPGLLPLGLVPSDPRAGGRDVLEVLPIALGSATLSVLPLLDAAGSPRALLESVELDIGGALSETDTEPAPARGPVALGLDALGLVIAGSVALLALGLAVLALRRWIRSRRRSAPLPAASPTPSLSPRERALRELAALLESGLHREGEAKAFGVALAEIGKDFFGGTHEITLRERTSWECAPLLRRAGCPEDAIGWLEGWLGRIDLVKFAGARPAADELESLAQALRARVEGAT